MTAGLSTTGSDVNAELVRLVRCSATSSELSFERSGRLIASDCAIVVSGISFGAIAWLGISFAEVRGKPFAPYERLFTPGAKPDEEPDEEPNRELDVELDNDPGNTPSKLSDGGCM